jgi:hypothetical protein
MTLHNPISSVSAQIRICWRELMNWIDIRSGPIDSTASKHRSAVLLWTGLYWLIDHSTVVSIGGGTFTYFGVTVDPPVAVQLGILVPMLLAYRLSGMWLSFITASGLLNAARIAHDREAPEMMFPSRTTSPAEAAEEESCAISARMRRLEFIWNLIVPSALGNV